MRIATWNVNSIRARHGRIVDWLVREDVDVLGMQEIKCKPEQFPYEAFEAAGYEVVAHGLNQWNGVAFASRLPVTEVETHFPLQPGFLKGHDGPELPLEARAMGVTVEGVRLWSLYVPNGRSLGDPHYTYKLDWLAALTDFTRAEVSAHPARPFALMGDFNIAPFDVDNGDPTVIVGQTTHVSPEERAAFAALEGAGVSDVVRSRVPEGLFTYWDYKQLRFPRNEGLRIDFVLGSPAFAERVADASIHRNERKGDAPSDHVPVLVELADAGADDADDDFDRPMFL
ncbi:exodeoxyribonuclease III [Agromyces sp. MMS24-JH15]|uniref:exodeoxyribonuclease III n=1 Tax=Agromyces sp. MMS24-JH15 TaxID=3243765 RepID=UPI0037489E1F